MTSVMVVSLKSDRSEDFSQKPIFEEKTVGFLTIHFGNFAAIFQRSKMFSYQFLSVPDNDLDIFVVRLSTSINLYCLESESEDYRKPFRKGGTGTANYKILRRSDTSWSFAV